MGSLICSVISACCAVVSLLVMLLNMRQGPVLELGAHVSGGQDEWEVLIHNGTTKPLSDVWITSDGKNWIHVASVIHPGETYTVLVSNGTRRTMGDVEKYARTDHTRIVCRWRSLFGWRPKVRLQVDEFTYPRGHRLTQAVKEFLGL